MVALPFQPRKTPRGNGQFDYDLNYNGKHYHFVAGDLGTKATCAEFNAMIGKRPTTLVDNDERTRQQEVNVDPEKQYDWDFHYTSMAERRAKDKIRSDWDKYYNS